MAAGLAAPSRPGDRKVAEQAQANNFQKARLIAQPENCVGESRFEYSQDRPDYLGAREQLEQSPICHGYSRPLLLLKSTSPSSALPSGRIRSKK
jgi:hypothetical protein